MKILFLTDEFYPNFGANSLLVKTLAKEFIKNEQQVFVMPFSCDKNLSKIEEHEGITVVRKNLYDGQESFKANLKKGKFITALKIIARVLNQKLSKKERVLDKDRIVARKILEDFINENKIDVVISICCSIELSFPLLYLRKKGKLNAKWIFYMIDPFESHEFYRGIENVQCLRNIQHDIMKNCDNVVATSLIYNDVKKWETKEILEKISIIEFPKIKKPIYNETENDIILDKTKINVVCTGTKNEKVRNSTYTLSLLEKLKNENIAFYFIGQGWGESINGNIIFYNAKPYEIVQNLQLNADCLLNVGNVVINQLPSKVLEYISTSKPIINVAKAYNCPTVDLLKNVDAITLYEGEDLEENVKKLKEFIFGNRKEMSFFEIEKLYEEYTPTCVAKQFLKIIGNKNENNE